MDDEPFVTALASVESQLEQRTWRTDPEYTKNLRHFQALIAGAAGIARRDADKREPLAEAVTVTHWPTTLEALLARRFELEQRLAQLGDEQYLLVRSAGYYAEGESTHVTWQKLFGDAPPPLLDVQADAMAKEATQLMLLQLLAAKDAQDLPLRARREFRHRALFHVVLPTLVAATVVLIVLLLNGPGDDRNVLLAAAAGATGAALGGLVKLRDQLTRGTEIREFAAFFFAQLVIGALAGLVVYLVDDAELISVSDAATGVAVISFATGFSEAAFIGLLSRFTLKE